MNLDTRRMPVLDDQKQRNREILESLTIDVADLIDELLFDYQHAPDSTMNPKAFQKTNDTGDWVMSCCPSHSENHPSFGISKEPPYHCNCFYCGYLGTIDEVIESTFGLTEGEGIARLLSQYMVGEERRRIDVEDIIESKRKAIQIPGLEEDVLTAFRDSRDTDTQIYDTAIQYMYSRGLNDITLEKYEIGVDIENNCIVFPQRTVDGDLRFLQKRRVGEQFVGAKFINDGSPVKKDILFGLHHIAKLKYTKNRIRRVRLVESPIDAMSNYQCGYAAVALNGKLLFKQQVDALHRAGVEIVDLMLDNDKAGFAGSMRAKRMLDKAGIHVNMVRYPNKFYKDSNALLMNNLMEHCWVKNVNLVGNL